VRLTITMEELSTRGDRVRLLLVPLSGKRDGPAWQPRATTTEYWIAAHDGSPSRSDIRDWRFSTIVPEYKAQYFERWMRTNTGVAESWYLERAYLHIFQFNQRNGTESEFLCLHCDPNESDDAAHALYKQGPHLHIHAGASEPIPHAHIALHVGYLDQVLNSVDSLSEALENAIWMLRDEILAEML
jgi:hypothetical protein